jgi:anti-anti-sigma regulatory factor
MTLRIERASNGGITTLRLIGRLGAEYVSDLLAQVRMLRPHVILDLDEVTLVDVAVVRFLVACERDGIHLRHLAPYIREWMDTEREREQ